MGFIRSKDPFCGLDDYLNSPEINLVSQSFHYPTQISCFPENPEYGLRVKSSYFYELLIQAIYGGYVKEKTELTEENSQTSLFSEPDLSSEKFYREVKSFRLGGDLKLLDEQMAKYCLLKTGEYCDKKSITFELFRHGIRHLQKDFKNKDTCDLLEDLAKNTRFMISLPFRIIFDIYTSKKSTRYDGQFYSHMSRLNSGPINKMISTPEEVLSDFGVDLNGLKFSKNKLPEGITVNGISINPFPILKVETYENEDWDKKFRDFLEDRKNHSFEFKTIMEEFSKGTLFEGQKIEVIKKIDPEDNPVNEVPF